MVKVKICGLTSSEDAKMACSHGADFVGVIVNVDVSTPREISLSKAKEVLEPVPGDVDSVAVTMPKSLEEIKRLDEKIETDYFQIHSGLSPSTLREIREETEKKIIGITSVPHDVENPEEIISRAKRVSSASDLLLLDTKGPGGGTGKTHDWKISSMIGSSLDIPLILAGGLNPSNVDEAIGMVNPFAVDAASGLESDPGKKDPDLVREFMDKVGA